MSWVEAVMLSSSEHRQKAPVDQEAIAEAETEVGNKLLGIENAEKAQLDNTEAIPDT